MHFQHLLNPNSAQVMSVTIIDILQVKVAKRLNTNKLKLPSVQQVFATTLERQLNEATGNDWNSLKRKVHSAALQVLGPATRNHQDWFDENDVVIQTLMEEKRKLHRAHQSDPTSESKKDAYVSKRSEVQRKLRIMQDTWSSNKADEIQDYANRHDMKRFFDPLKTIYGPPTSGSSTMLSADGKELITDKNNIVERWA